MSKKIILSRIRTNSVENNEKLEATGTIGTFEPPKAIQGSEHGDEGKQLEVTGFSSLGKKSKIFKFKHMMIAQCNEKLNAKRIAGSEDLDEDDKHDDLFMPCSNEAQMTHGNKAITPLSVDPRGTRLASGPVDYDVRTQVVRPRALSLFRQEWGKRSRRIIEKYMLNLELSKMVEDYQDPEEALLEYAKGAEENPYWITPAYERTQPQAFTNEYDDKPISKKRKCD